MAFHQINGIKVRATFEYPPIPIRQFDWSAIDDDTYDGAEDSHCPIGRGATEQDAIKDLIEQLQENDTDGSVEGSDAWNEANGQFGVGA